MSFLNGDLDQVFTVLYEMGRVEPLLKRDWKKLFVKSHERWVEVNTAIQSLNSLGTKTDIRGYIEKLPSPIVDALVVEVARELAAFYDRNEFVH